VDAEAEPERGDRLAEADAGHHEQVERRPPEHRGQHPDGEAEHDHDGDRGGAQK